MLAPRGIRGLEYVGLGLNHLCLMKRTNPVILVVDDDSNDQMLIQSAFHAAAVTAGIRTASSGDEAIAYLSGEGKFGDRSIYPYPDFVITDLKMPNGDGFAVLEHFKKNPNWAVIPTVVLSGSQDNDDIKKAYLLGASAYHVKPSSPLALRGLIKALHDYWLLCEVPEIDRNGQQVETDSAHKLGRRFAQPGRV